MLDLVKIAITKGAKLYLSISAGKDSQAMSRTIFNNGLPIEGFVHADLGRTEWAGSMAHCQKIAQEYNRPLHVVTRSDGADMVTHWRARLSKLKAEGNGTPFWSSSKNRYCTSDMKRDPSNVFFTSTGNDFIISCEGIRAQESNKRAQKDPFTIRRGTSSFYKGMSVEQAIANFTPGKRLCLTWYPIFTMSLEEVWGTYGMKSIDLIQAQEHYLHFDTVPYWWPFHNAYVYGNERLSCMFCILGSLNDLQVAAKHNPELLAELISMEEEGNATFKDGWSLKNLL